MLLLAAAGCKSNNEEVSGPATSQAPAVVETTPAPAAPAAIAITGKVVETADAGEYTYVKVDTGAGEQWVAIPATTLEVGQEVSLAPGMEMTNLESKALGRTFESVIFSRGPVAEGAASSAAAGESFNDAMMQESRNVIPGTAMGSDMASSGGSKAAVVASADVKVDKAEGENAYTVGEVYARRNDLNGQKVKIRGKVMKVSMMIMGKNWVHIQDGTGNASDNTHDLVVTTMAEPEKDSVVVVEGTLVADKDFGAGYRYDVIIEDAEIQ